MNLSLAHLDSKFHQALDTGDIELRFQDGRSIKAHSQKLKLASMDGILHNLIEDVVDNRPITNSRRSPSSTDLLGDNTDSLAEVPHLKVIISYWLVVSCHMYAPQAGMHPWICMMSQDALAAGWGRASSECTYPIRRYIISDGAGGRWYVW